MIVAKSEVKEMALSAVIIRADGTVEDLGTVSYWHKNIFKQILWKVKQWLRSS